MSSTGASAESSVRIICGPTGAGKSALAMQLAESQGAIIVSADSRQIYRGFNIGTAKPTLAERERVLHRGLDVSDPAERYSAARWAEDARGWLRDAAEQGTAVIIVGGTGFYIRALTDPLFESPELDEARRAELEQHLASMPTDELRRWCEALDRERAHLGRTQLLRAIETALLTGSRMSDLHRTGSRAPGIVGRYLVVDPSDRLPSRLEQRFDAMIRAGWADEVSTLVRTIDGAAPAWKASGYAAMREMVEGRIPMATARERVIIETRQYAKRQRTWFRHQLPSSSTTRVDPLAAGADRIVRDWWDGRGA